MTRALIGLLPLALHATTLVLVLALGMGTVWALPAYPIVLVLVTGAVARTGLRHIRRGRFDRDPGAPLYRGRMLYGAAWTSIYYCKPILHVLLSSPQLKRLTFRLFGYRGDMDFTIYPDTWIRDLALLDFGPGTYIANRVTLGTNQVRDDGRIQVSPIRTGKNVIVGHLGMVGGGVKIGDDAELGVASKVGFNTRIGARVKVGPETVVDGGTRLHDDVVIGARCYIGKGCVIHRGVHVTAGSVIPDRTVIRSDADLRLHLAA